MNTKPHQAKQETHLDSRRHVCFLLNNMGKQSYFHFGTNQNFLFSLARKNFIFTTGVAKAGKALDWRVRVKAQNRDGRRLFFSSEALDLKQPIHCMHKAT